MYTIEKAAKDLWELQSPFRQRLAILRKDVYCKQVLEVERKAKLLLSAVGNNPKDKAADFGMSSLDMRIAASNAKLLDWPAGPREGDVVLFDELDAIARKYGLI